MKLTLEKLTTIDIATARFSFVWPHVDPTHPRTMLLTAYVPILKMIIAVYRAARLRVAHASTNPAMATHLANVI
jgi:hypothetical protein